MPNDFCQMEDIKNAQGGFSRLERLLSNVTRRNTNIQKIGELMKILRSCMLDLFGGEENT